MMTHNSSCADCIGVGHKRHEPLTVQEKLYLQVTIINDTVQDHVLHFRSMFMPLHGYEGTLYRIGEFIFIQAPGQIETIRLTDIMFVACECKYNAVVKGELYTDVIDHDGIKYHQYSGSKYVKPMPIQRTVLAEAVLRKIMIFPDTDHLDEPSCYIIIDHLRPCIPLKVVDVIVPFYPEIGDMIKVKGTMAEEVWLAHVININGTLHTCQVHFYVHDDSYNSDIRYKQEHKKLETVHWDSILGQSVGHWRGKYWITT